MQPARGRAALPDAVTQWHQAGLGNCTPNGPARRPDPRPTAKAGSVRGLAGRAMHVQCTATGASVSLVGGVTLFTSSGCCAWASGPEAGSEAANAV